MKLLFINVLLLFLLYSQVVGDDVLIPKEEEKELPRVIPGTEPDSSSDDSTSDSNESDSKESVSDESNSDSSNSESASSDTSEDSDSNSSDLESLSAQSSSLVQRTDPGELKEYSRMKMREEGNIRSSTDDIYSVEMIPVASIMRLKYAPVSEDKNTKINENDDNDDDSTETGKNIEPPRIFSNPRFKKIFGQNTPDNNNNPNFAKSTKPSYSVTPATFEDDQQRFPKPDFELTLGGYQRQDQSSPNKVASSVTISESKKPEEDDRKDEEATGNKVEYREPQTPFQGRMLPQQSFSYIPNLPDPFSTPETQYHYPQANSDARVSFRYPDYVPTDFRNRPTFDSPALDYNAALLGRFRANDINGFTPVMGDYYRTDVNAGIPLSTNYFAGSTTPDIPNAFGTASPFNVQRSLTAQSAAGFQSYQGRPQTYPVMSNSDTGVRLSQSDLNMFARNFGDQPPLDPAFLIPRNPVATTSGPGSDSSSRFGNNYQNAYFPQFENQHVYLVNRNSPYPTPDPARTEQKDGLKAAENGEQESESVSQEQNEEPKSDTDNLYLNYPTKQAGYGTQEQLPAQNESDYSNVDPPSTSSKKSLGSYSDNTQIGRYRFQHFPGSPFLNINRTNSFPFSQDNGTRNPENITKTFNSEDFYKNFKLPSQFNYPHHPTLDSGVFSDFPDNSPSSPAGRPIFPHHPTLNSGVFSDFPDNSPSTPAGRPAFYPAVPESDIDSPPRRVRPFPQSSYDFFSNRGETNIDEEQVPDCAKAMNSTICFEDASYPRNDILHSLDSEALLLLRILPPTSTFGIVDSKGDDVINEEATADEDMNICTSDVKKGSPLRAMNTQGKWKVIVNLGDPSGRLNQNVVLETCRGVRQPCSYTDQSISSQCVQKHSSQRLFVWNRERGLHTDVFRLPVSCSCQIIKVQK